MGYTGKVKRSIQAKRDMRGVAVVEFALLLFLLLILVAGIVEFGRAFWYYDAVTKATRDGARFLSLSEDFETDTITMVKNTVDMARVPGFLTTDVTVICDYDIGSGTGTDCSTADYIPDYVTVSIAYPVKIGEWIPFVTLANAPWNVTLTPSTTMRYMCDEPESC
jgi:Flp pilus assembly protein TadG